MSLAAWRAVSVIGRASVGFAMLLVAACGGGSGSTGAVTLVSIAAAPKSISLNVGATQVLSVTGTYSNGAMASVTTGLGFSSSATGVATVDASGVVAGVAPGTAQIDVTDGMGGFSAAPVTVAVLASSAANSLPVVVDQGPAVLVASGQTATNTLFASATICTPGSASACQTIDHLQIDTGSTGIQILSAVLTGAATTTPASVNGAPLRECVQFADGYTWGSVVIADVQLGGRTIASLPIHLIGDAAAGTAPSSCSTGAGPAENTVAAFGANGLIGVGNFLQDCGAYCATPPAPSAAYYACPSSGCLPTTLAVTQQVQNPVAMLAADNNGIVIGLPSVGAPGAASVSGTLYFGVGTQADNAPSSAAFLTVDPATGTLITNFGGAALTGSVIDSGSNAYFFNDSSIAVCAINSSFFCPVDGSGAPTNLALTATLQGINGVTAAAPFTIGNANSLFGAGANLTAFPTLGGPNGSVGGSITGFDWGLPFFFSRSVYILFEAHTAAATAGPAIGFD
ncbi:MAG TPA: DUF3443 family protein [Steroidobacteraceae bacterium]|nr:DUF3443 family protein [Steroidobacteraceae bacterium]